MKSELAMMVLLVMGIFAGAINLVMAEETSAVDVSAIESSDTGTPGEIQDTLKEMENLNQYKRVGFSNVWRGKGWIENGKFGHLMNGFWINQGFVKIRANNSSIKDSNILRSFGRLRISSAGIYKLIEVKKDVIEPAANVKSIGFYVIPMDNKKYADEEAMIRNSVGKLVLNKEKQYNGLTTWKGYLAFEEGSLKGSWNVEFGTSKKVVKTAKAIALGRKAKKISFWRKVQFWRTDKVEAQNSLDKNYESNTTKEINKNKKNKRIPFWRIFSSADNENPDKRIDRRNIQAKAKPIQAKTVKTSVQDN